MSDDIDAYVTQAAYDTIKRHSPDLAKRVAILGSSELENEMKDTAAALENPKQKDSP